jgi:exonuclease III
MPNGVTGGDYNCINNSLDCTHNPETKLSPCMRRLINNFNWTDTFRALYPTARTFSHFYSRKADNDKSFATTGATRIDRLYIYGDVPVVDATYVPVAFSDHLLTIYGLNWREVRRFVFIWRA